MGIIEKQATKNIISSYLGAGLGFITVLWMSHLLRPSENGLIRILISYSALFSQFANLGFTSTTIRFFPYFKNKEKGHHGFLYYALLVTSVGFILCWFVYLGIKPQLIESNREKSQLFVDYIFYLMPLTLFTVFFNILDSYLRASYSSVIGSFSKEVVQRILILATLLLYFLNIIKFEVFLFLYIAFTCLPTLMLIFYIIKNKEWHTKPVKGFLNNELKNEMTKISFYSILTGGAVAVIANIDAIMINQYLGEKYAGIYGIAFYFGAIIVIPARSLYRITSSIIAESFKNNQIEDVKKIYTQSCNTQLTIGALLFIGIFANINNIMQILPSEYALGKNIILIIGAGYLIEMATGVNQVIIANSKFFRFDTYFVLVLVGTTILTNWIFIPRYGIEGAAFATALTIVFGNFLRFGLLYMKLDMQPYNFNSLKILAIGALCFLIGFYIPPVKNLFIDIAVRSSAISIVFILLLLKSGASPEINNKIRKNLKRFSINI